MEDDNDYESHNLIWKTQNIDSYLNKEQFNDWVAINNAHKINNIEINKIVFIKMIERSRSNDQMLSPLISSGGEKFKRSMKLLYLKIFL